MFYKIDDGEFIYDPLFHKTLLDKLNMNLTKSNNLKSEYNIGITILHVTKSNIYSFFSKEPPSILGLLDHLKKLKRSVEDTLINNIIDSTEFFITLVKDNNAGTTEYMEKTTQYPELKEIWIKSNKEGKTKYSTPNLNAKSEEGGIEPGIETVIGSGRGSGRGRGRGRGIERGAVGGGQLYIKVTKNKGGVDTRLIDKAPI